MEDRRGSANLLSDLEAALREVAPEAILTPPRILRRVIKHDCRITAIGLKVPHRKTYTIDAAALLEIVERDELGLPPHATLSGPVILLARPHADQLDEMPLEELLLKYWRLLFHARVHVALDERVAAGELTLATARQRIHRLGQVEFDEARNVLRHEELLLPPRDDLAAYIEFVALYWELQFFAPALIACYFPAIIDFGRFDQVLSEDINAEEIFIDSRLEGAPKPTKLARGTADEFAFEAPPEELRETPTLRTERRLRKLRARANKASALGNVVRGAILRMQVARLSLPNVSDQARLDACEELDRLAARLQAALGLSDQEADAWHRALPALLDRSARGGWTAEARLLYDLQKACVDHEREIYTLDVVGWLLSKFQRPIQRFLPSQREVLMSKHLRSAARRLTAARLSAGDRQLLSELLQDAVDLAEHRLRERFRPVITEVLEDVGLHPRNLPERVARHKLVEELLDQIIDYGFITIGNLRDAISRNNLKLPDLTGASEFALGDQLLRADRQLADSLDGVYHRGELYLRWPQRLSSLAFGTAAGRFLTRWVAIPFGGAYLALAGLQHIVHLLSHKAPTVAEEAMATQASAGVQLETPLAVIGVGLLLMGAMHSETFRVACLTLGRALTRGLRALFVDLPRWFLDLGVIRRIRESRVFALVGRFVIKPLIFTAVASFGLQLPAVGWTLSPLQYVGFFLIVNLLVNSRLGRNIDELVTDWVVRGWHHFRLRILTAVYQLIVDLSNRFLETVERMLYTVDEWLRFRRGERRRLLAVKAVLGIVWFFVTYVIRFCVTLLIEPQVNPIKHFPVVTVSHKILLPMTGAFAELMTPPLGKEEAAAIATALVLVTPGVVGFLVWELKENWRLYAANRPKKLGPVVVGHHGERMLQFLKPGFHSGTVPKLYARLRRAGRKSYWTGNWKSTRKYREALHRVEESIRHFVERDFLMLLAQSKSWRAGAVSLGHVQLGSNLVRIELVCPQTSPRSTWLCLADQSGWLVSRVVQSGWLLALAEAELQTFANSLAGFYKLAGVDMVHEQIVAGLEPAPPLYDIAEDGLVVWPNGRFESEVVYDLRDSASLAPLTTSAASHAQLPALDRQSMVFANWPLYWQRWLEIWERDQSDERPVPRILDYTRLLPDLPGPAKIPYDTRADGTMRPAG